MKMLTVFMLFFYLFPAHAMLQEVEDDIPNSIHNELYEQHHEEKHQTESRRTYGQFIRAIFTNDQKLIGDLINEKADEKLATKAVEDLLYEAKEGMPSNGGFLLRYLLNILNDRGHNIDEEQFKSILNNGDDEEEFNDIITREDVKKDDESFEILLKEEEKAEDRGLNSIKAKPVISLSGFDLGLKF